MSRKFSLFKHLDFLIIDLLCIELSFFIACQLRQHVLSDLTYEYIMAAGLIAAVFIIIVLFWNIYSGILRRDVVEEIKSVFAVNAGIFVALNMFLFATKRSEVYSRVVIYSFFIISTILMAIIRYINKKIILHRKKTHKDELILIVKSVNMEACLKHFDKEDSGVRISAIILYDNVDMVEFQSIPIVGHIDDLREYVESNNVDGVFVHVPDEDLDKAMEMLTLKGIIVYKSLRSLRKSSFRYRAEQMNGYTILSIREKEIPLGQAIIKRITDVFFSLFGIIVSSPIWIVIAILVKLQDGGPVFYASKRIGYNGKHINVYKFRSMKLNADRLEDMLTPEQLEKYHREYKLDYDPRVTKLGEFIRKTSIDELPQLFNILKGDMSFIGPRPIMQEETELYGDNRSLLLSLKPGLTGYWQARGRNNVTYESGKRQAMELYYIENFSWLLDVKILFWTVKAVLTGDGAK